MIDVVVTCRVCRWKASDTIGADGESAFAEVLKFVNERAEGHSHGNLGSWLIEWGSSVSSIALPNQ